MLALPNEWVPRGWGFLGPAALVPVFWFTSRHGPLLSLIGAAVWISLVTGLAQAWLLAFHPLAFPLALLFQIPWYAALFAASSLLWRLPGGAWLQALLWTVFEYLRIQGFFAFPYGSIASAFWEWPIAFQSADVVGMSGLVLLLSWTSAWLAGLLATDRSAVDVRGLAAGLMLWAADLGYGAWCLSRPETGSVWRPALVQPSQDPWAGGPAAYESGFETLTALSRKALTGDRAPDAVVWPETAFVPSVEYHTRYHDNPESLRLVRRLETFLASSSVPFLVGNDHREKAVDGTISDFNAVLAWDEGWKGRYEKNRLVPFTESFPYKNLLPWVYRWLQDSDTHFWEPGVGHRVLLIGGVTVGTPVCFEDAFPDGARAFAQHGAQVLVNMTNDAWAPGVASRMQHLSLAVFRSVETRRPLVRAADDGATAAVSLRGELKALLPVGPPGVLNVEVRLGSGTTLYVAWGDWFAWTAAAFLAVWVGWNLTRRVDKGEQL